MVKGLVRQTVGAFRELGGSVGQLAMAEIDQLLSDFGDSGRKLAKLAVLVAIAGAIAFWALAVLLFAAVAGLALWLPPWAAALVVAAILLAAVVVLALLAQRRWRDVEMPAETLRRRAEDHARWWQELTAAEAAAARPSREGPPRGEDPLYPEDEQW